MATRVSFVLDTESDTIVALFPDEPASCVDPKLRTVFDPVGGHGSYSNEWAAASADNVPPARKAEADRVLRTLTHVYEYTDLVVLPYWGDMLPSCVRLYKECKTRAYAIQKHSEHREKLNNAIKGIK